MFIETFVTLLGPNTWRMKRGIDFHALRMINSSAIKERLTEECKRNGGEQANDEFWVRYLFYFNVIVRIINKYIANPIKNYTRGQFTPFNFFGVVMAKKNSYWPRPV